MRKSVLYGYCVRQEEPPRQAAEPWVFMVGYSVIREEGRAARREGANDGRPCTAAGAAAGSVSS